MSSDSSDKVSLIAKLTAADGKAAELEAALHALIDAADEENGLEIYSVHRDAEVAGVYYFFELYSDQGSLDVHGKGDAMKAAMGAVGGLLGGAPEIHRMTPVVAKGMNL